MKEVKKKKKKIDVDLSRECSFCPRQTFFKSVGGKKNQFFKFSCLYINIHTHIYTLYIYIYIYIYIHPPQVIKQLPTSVGERLSNNSSNE